MMRLANEAGRIVVPLPVGETDTVSPATVAAALAANPAIGTVGLVYNETGTGIAHDAAAIGAVVRAAGRRLILDAVSAFGALPLDLARQPEIDAVLFTANKCLEAMPGLAVAIARIDRLRDCKGNAQSWSLDLTDMWHNGQVNGFGYARFTPPAQVINALRTALDLYDAEGGQPARLSRYEANVRTLREGMRRLGLSLCVADELQGPIVVNVFSPPSSHWDLHLFVEALKRRGFLISNFYNTRRPSFRVGCIGALEPNDMRRAVTAMGDALGELGIRTKEPV
jgi:2-aminoethylphosphonate-pyruvate transaminase